MNTPSSENLRYFLVRVDGDASSVVAGPSLAIAIRLARAGAASVVECAAVRARDAASALLVQPEAWVRYERYERRQK